MPDGNFPIVCLGASAGGLEACKAILAKLPREPRMAFVVVQHLNPSHPSQLPQILQQVTPMPVMEITDGIEVQPNHVYVIPSNAAIDMVGGQIRTTERGPAPRPDLLIDRFLRSLARNVQSRAVAVVLSGSGSDGTLGACEVKAAGGVTIAQDEKSAAHAGMPRSAANSGCVDFVLPVEDICGCLLKLDGHPYLSDQDPRSEDDVRTLQEIVGFLHKVTGMDFSQYRNTTISRRILRRAMLFGHRSLNEYAELLRKDGAEVQALYRDLLINVTSFFRDPKLFETLKNTAFPALLASKGRDEAIRVWVAGCSTGQEAYSIAITLFECVEGRAPPQIQIFATDLSGETLPQARAGIYPDSIEADVSPERLRRFFTKEGSSYRIINAVREACVFAQQDMTVDPPFTHIDLISCRNVMIYMSPVLQQRVLSMFHFALNVPGYLVLGSAETVGQMAQQFELVDKTSKIFAKKPGPRVYPRLGDTKLRMPGSTGAPAMGGNTFRIPDYRREASRVLLERYAPPGVLVNEDLEVLEFRGRTSDYLEVPEGAPTNSLAKLVQERTYLELRSTIEEAKESGNRVLRKGVGVGVGNALRNIDLEVSPVDIPSTGERCFLVMFHAADVQAHTSAMGTGTGFWGRLLELAVNSGDARNRGKPDGDSETQEIERLRRELQVTKEYLQSLVEERDVGNEELRISNEEVMSSNEELQSTNEELETVKEELQSANEELTTINEEVNHRNVELTQINNDFSNLLSSTNLPLVVVGSDLRIRLYTPPASTTMNLLPTDIGRPIGHIRPAIAFDNLEDLIRQVIETGQPYHNELQDKLDKWHALRIYPYRAVDRTDGAVIVLVDIDDMRRSQDMLRQQTNLLKLADQRKNEFLAMLGHELRNPLGPMSNALQILHLPQAKEPEREHATGVLDRQLAQLTRIVEDLLDATRIAQGKIELRRERLDLNALIHAAMETSQPIMLGYSHQLETSLCAPGTFVEGDPLRLNQVLVNLLNNAAKFTPGNGHIVLSCKVAEHEGREMAVISVRDNGIGMNADLLAHVFELFTQGESFENRRRGGLGVGLTVAQRLVELHDGTIDAQSEGEGKGSEFIVRIPLAREIESRGGPQDRIEEKPAMRPRRVLVVEDNVDQAQTLSALMTLWGHEVKTAHDGIKSIEIAEEFRPDIALVDLGLPSISGYQVARLFRSNPKLRQVRLVAQTGWGQTRDRVLTKEAGFDDHLVKPLDVGELQRVLGS